ncbi:hypothetical protein MSAN_02072200 [Mycena sanguinolenta]|uniref:Uncharacterized protein n=1 Tax=Mycena sanguinolenta TaxID=230812 RepID=A0A8H6XJU1_9AGAR|nr:hypothetical protein MSAN_02072200 [Mycena sanguinolenta]
MAQTPVFSLLYQYALVGAVSVAIILVVLLCLRSRILERDRLHNMRPLLADLAQKPCLFDAYLDGHAELWHDIMPLSLYPVVSQSATRNAPKQLDPTSIRLASGLSTVALIIAMPCSDPTGHADGDEDGEPPPLPYLEFGLRDIEISRERLST